MSDDRLFRHPGIQLLRQALRREMRLQLITCISLAVLGLVLSVAFFASSIILTIIGLFFMVIGINLTYQAARGHRPDDHPLMEVLRHQPHRVVWVYSVVTQRMPFGLQFSQNGILYFKLIDGDQISVSAPRKHLKLISKTLNRLLPHASFGYTKDREQWFLASPELLLRSKQDE